MSDGEVRYLRDGSVVTVTFDRPAARNAMTWRMYEQLGQACARMQQEDGLRVAIFRGAGGKSFIAGTDIAQFQAFSGAADGIAYEEDGDRRIGRLEAVRKPVIAAIQGFAVGAGLRIAAACDLRIATPDARFGAPIARTLGNCLSMASYNRLVYLVGPSLVKDIVFQARLIEADEALAKGLVSELLDDQATLMKRAEELVRTVAGMAPLTLQATKEAILRLRPKIEHGEGNDIVLMCYMSQDFREGMDAFLNKRKPVWKGR